MAIKKAEVYYNNSLAGSLVKENGKYYFKYSDDYLTDDNKPAISLSLPKRKEAFVSDFLFPFFFGLLAEGDNKELQCRILKIDENDNFTRLLKTAGKDTIGGVTVKEIL
jgi:HipA-like protein